MQNKASVMGRWSVRWQGGAMDKNGSTVASLIGGLGRIIDASEGIGRSHGPGKTC